MKRILSIVAILLSLVMSAFALGLTVHMSKQVIPHNEDNAVFEGTVLTQDGENTGISVMSKKLSVAEYGDYGIMPLAETAYTLTATIQNEAVTDGKIDWSIAWADEAVWTDSNPIANYLTITPTLSGSKTATLTLVKGGFRVPGVVTATLRNDPSIKATCTVNYLRRPATYSFYTYNTGSDALYKNGIKIGEETWLANSTDKGTEGTVDGVFNITSATLEVNDAYFWVPVRNNRYFTKGLSTLGMPAGALAPKYSIPVTVTSPSSLKIPSLTSFFSINGNGALGSYVQNAIAEVMKGASGSMNIVQLTLKGTYGLGDVSINFTATVGITHYVLDAYTVPTVSI